MKRMWRNLLTMLALVASTNAAAAQDAFSQPSAIGSYQSILSRAGYGSAGGSATRAIADPGSLGTVVQDTASMGVQQFQGAVQGAVQGTYAPPASSMVSQSPIVGSSVISTPATGQVYSAPAISSPMVSSPVVSGGVVGSGCSTCSGGSVYGDMISAPATYSTPVAYSAPVSYAAPVYQAPVYQSIVAPTVNRAPRANRAIGIYGLNFQRDYEDGRFIARNTAGETLYTDDADEQNFDGYGVSLTSRRANGSGFQVDYWALNPGRASAVLTGGNVYTTITALDQLIHTSSGRDLHDIYANTLTQTIVRETDINNLEFNFLRNGGTFCTRRCGKGFYELLAGFRWFEFDESLQYQAFIDTNAFPLVPNTFFYDLDARNRLLGFQLGARNEICLSSKFRLFSGVKGGLFNNNIRTRQVITDANSEIAVVNSGTAAGRNFDYSDEKNDLAFLGELDFGVIYQLSCRSRIRLGYRALGVSGVALAADQIPHRFNEPESLLKANSNGSLLLGGGYYGLEFCF